MQDQKIKKSGKAPAPLTLAENPDILATVARRASKRPALVIGFAAETEQVVAHAREKLAAKGCDWIVANDVSPETGVFGGDRNTVHLVTASGVESWPPQSKDQVARNLITRVAAELEKSK
jgi:phosphopantothenoylcysteine decarboxylase/phosphopantothenate--cysteine ligase